MGRQWIIGDIHGCIRTFRELVEEEIRPAKTDTLFLLGDLIDRGPGSKAVIDYIRSLREHTCAVQSVLGNHEWMLLRSLASEEIFFLWMRNKGFTTLRDFGIAAGQSPGPELANRIPSSYLDFFKTLPLFLETERFILVHAGLNPSSENPLEDVETLLWTRDEDYPEQLLRGRKLIHGHTPIPAQEIIRRTADRHTRVINLDGGCVYPHIPGYGNLVAWEPGSGELKIVRNQE